MASLVQTQIVNVALVQLGKGPVTDISASVPCATIYPILREQVLTWYPWNFATVRQQLVKMTEVPASEFRSQFALPTNPRYLRAINVALNGDRGVDGTRYRLEHFRNPNNPGVEQAVLATDAEEVILEYVADIDEAFWSPLVRKALSTWIAGELAEALTGKADLGTRLLQQKEGELQRATTVDSHMDSPRRVEFDNRYIFGRAQGRSSRFGEGLFIEPRVIP